MNERFRVVMVGCGGMSRAWLNQLKNFFSEEVEIVGLVDLSEELARERATEFNLTEANISTDLAGSLSALQPDAVFDVTVPKAHHQVTMTALDAGCHVLGEKPLAESMEQAEEMVEAARKAGKLYAVIQNRRYLPGLRTAQQFLASGAIGQIHTVDVDFYCGPHFGGFREEIEHVLLLDMAIHTFDAARAVMGGAKALNVYCHEFNPPGSWYYHGASATAAFEMEKGITFNYRGSWCAEGHPTSWEGQWRIVGTRGTLIWDGNEQLKAQSPKDHHAFIREVEDLPIEPVPVLEKERAHAGLIRDFLTAVRTGEEPETVASDNIHSLAMVLAAIRSSQAGQRVGV